MNKRREFSPAQQKALDFVTNRLKEIRIEKGYTSYEYLAYDIGVSRAQYGTYEKGANITITTLAKILDKLDVSFEEFFKTAH
jgi:transcriptional regulator with XRE-family HTH domain